MLTAFILDREILENIVTGFLEDDLYIPGFKTETVERGPDHLIWKFVFEPEEPEIFTECTAMINNCGAKEVTLFKGQGIHLCGGDILRIEYRVNWWREGNDDDRVTLPAPVPGASLCFESVAV